LPQKIWLGLKDPVTGPLRKLQGRRLRCGKDRYVVVPPPRYNNVENYQIKGVEASLTVYPFKDLALFGGMTYLETDPSDRPSRPNTPPAPGCSRPRSVRSFSPASPGNLSAGRSSPQKNAKCSRGTGRGTVARNG
jgi:outer membrane receptor protein involved in Fe transport